MTPLVSTGANVDPTVRIGNGSMVFAGAFIAGNTTIGQNCTIMDGVIIGHDVTIGDRVAVFCEGELNAISIYQATLYDPYAVGSQSVPSLAHIAIAQTYALAAAGGNAWTVTGKGAIEMSTELLTARVRLSLAQMYLSDLRNGVDFGRMVDARGAGFACSAALWRERIRKIADEIAALLPDEARNLLSRTGEGQP